MRNVDKIKTLEKELGRYQKKVADQQKEVMGLRAELELAMEGTKELNTVVDAIMAEITVAHGTVLEEGVWELVIPLVSIRRNSRDYHVMARVSEDNDSYTLRVIRKETEEQEESDGAEA